MNRIWIGLKKFKSVLIISSCLGYKRVTDETKNRPPANMRVDDVVFAPQNGAGADGAENICACAGCATGAG